MSITSIAPISFHEDGIDKRGELDLTESHLVFKSGFQDRLNLAYSNIREYRQSEAQDRISIQVLHAKGHTVCRVRQRI